MTGRKVFCAVAALLGLAVALAVSHPAYGHFYGGQTRTFGNYSIVFVPSPDPPLATDNKTKINFSILQYGNNIYNIAASMTLKGKNGTVLFQTPLRPYEFSDISIPLVFPKPGDYVVSLETMIVGDPDYSDKPLVADFNVSAMDPNMPVPLDELMLLYVTPTSVVIGGLVVYLHSRGRL